MLRRRCRPSPSPAAALLSTLRRLSRVAPPSVEVTLRVSNNVARLGPPKGEPKPRQLMSLPPFPGSAAGVDALPGRRPCSDRSRLVTAIGWVAHCLADVPQDAVQRHFRKKLVFLECSDGDISSATFQGLMQRLRKIKHNDVMRAGMRIHIPVSVAEAKIDRRYDTIPTATLHPNADEIEYIRRLVVYKDSAIIVLNKPPKVPMKGNLPVHNAMDVLAAAAFSYGSAESPKLVDKLDKESSGLLLLGRTKESFIRLNWLFTSMRLAKTSSQVWNRACEGTSRRYWALVLGTPKEREGIISAKLTKVILDDGKAERIILAHSSGMDGSQEAITEYRVMGPTINGCSWIELRPLTSRKHQLRVHCAEALGTPIVGDYKYGWFMHERWKQSRHDDYEPSAGEPYKLRRPYGLEIQKGSVLSKVPLLHLHCREMVIPNVAKFLDSNTGEWNDDGNPWARDRPDLLRFVAPMPPHMKISWNLMSSYLV